MRLRDIWHILLILLSFRQFIHAGESRTEVTRDSSTVIACVYSPSDTLPARHPFRMALHTNALYDLAAVPNIGAEFYLGHGMSLSADWMHAWWSAPRRHRYWRIYGPTLTLRRHLGATHPCRRHAGHHIGIYLQALTYDFQWGRTVHMGGKPGGTLLDRAQFGAGIEYGYTLPVAWRLNIDFAVGIGYFGGRVSKWRPTGDHYEWLSTRHRHWIGPTRAAVSIVWLIGRDNVNMPKGGATP